MSKPSPSVTVTHPGSQPCFPWGVEGGVSPCLPGVPRLPATGFLGTSSLQTIQARGHLPCQRQAPLLRIVAASSCRKGHLAFSVRYFDANLFPQKEKPKQMWAIWQRCSSFVSKCKGLFGRILNITLAIHKHFIF